MNEVHAKEIPTQQIQGNFCFHLECIPHNIIYRINFRPGLKNLVIRLSLGTIEFHQHPENILQPYLNSTNYLQLLEMNFFIASNGRVRVLCRGDEELTFAQKSLLTAFQQHVETTRSCDIILACLTSPALQPLQSWKQP
jgi:hypothetical protein